MSTLLERSGTFVLEFPWDVLATSLFKFVVIFPLAGFVVLLWIGLDILLVNYIDRRKR